MTSEPDTPPNDDTAEAPESEPLPLLPLRDGVPDVIDTQAAFDAYLAQLSRGSGPVGLDAERASGYRYSQRAYLIQVRREGAGTALIDPIAFDDLSGLDAAIGDDEWILHAATQDLPCLREVGMAPRALFDTELAGRLLGYPRVGLAALVEAIVGLRMRKEHSAADWSERPLPEAWLEYAALDVEVLEQLRDHLAAELAESGKEEWAAQEFAHLLDFAPTPRAEPWRRTSGIHRIKDRRRLAAVRSLWLARDDIARTRDVSPGRLIPDAAISAAATAMPSSVPALLGTKGFHGRGARRHASRWLAAIEEARGLDEADLPGPPPRGDGPPHVRNWADRDPVAAARLVDAREAIAALAEEVNTPVENLLTPDSMRRVLWTPPKASDTDMEDAVAEALRDLGARAWQVDLTAPLISGAILRAG